MNKKIFMLFSLFVILSMLLAACGGGKQETSQVDTLRVDSMG